MSFKTVTIWTALLTLFASSIAGCTSVGGETMTPATAVPSVTSPAADLSSYAFPVSIDPSAHYMFYLHGRIIEDQGLPAISPDYGEYEYMAILEKLASYGYRVISEQRTKNTDGMAYARKVTEQVKTLLNAGVPAKNITVVGASKGGGIAIYVSHYLENKDASFVLLSICHPDTVASLIQEGTYLVGNVLSIYDESDTLAGSCGNLFSFSQGKGLARLDEIVLHIGTGHGILFQPLDAWVAPTIQWAGK